LLSPLGLVDEFILNSHRHTIIYKITYKLFRIIIIRFLVLDRSILDRNSLVCLGSLAEGGGEGGGRPECGAGGSSNGFKFVRVG